MRRNNSNNDTDSRNHLHPSPPIPPTSLCRTFLLVLLTTVVPIIQGYHHPNILPFLPSDRPSQVSSNTRYPLSSTVPYHFRPIHRSFSHNIPSPKTATTTTELWSKTTDTTGGDNTPPLRPRNRNRPSIGSPRRDRDATRRTRRRPPREGTKTTPPREVVLPLPPTPTATVVKDEEMEVEDGAGGDDDWVVVEDGTAPLIQEKPPMPNRLNEMQTDFTMGYLNKHHPGLFISLAEAFTRLGVELANRSVGSYDILDGKIIDLDYDSGLAGRYLYEEKDDDDEDRAMGNSVTLEVNVRVRGESTPRVETVKVFLDAQPKPRLKRKYTPSPPIPPLPNPTTIDPVIDFTRRFSRLCHIVHNHSISGKLIQLASQIGSSRDKEHETNNDCDVGNRLLLRENLYLNQVPNNRYIRRYFYDMISEAVMDAVIGCSEGLVGNRMVATLMFPEMNPMLDSYRIGTLLEAARAISITLAEENLRVRVCIQESMGYGIFAGTPKQLSGASMILRQMDWQSGPGEENEGLLGDYVNFGGIGKEHVVNEVRGTEEGEVLVEQDDVFLLLCPQSMVGTDTSILGPLEEMVEAAGDRPVILLNPDLEDKISSQGQQSVRGRQQRIDFAQSFKTIFHFNNMYPIGASYFPILGAVTKVGPTRPWIAYQRRDRVDGEGEVYVPVLSTEEKPSNAMIMDAFE